MLGITSNSIFEWLLTPLSGQAEHILPLAVAWHGRLMVLGWNILLPIGILIARFFKVTPRQNWPDRLDNKAWWYCHFYLQHSGLIIAVIALGLILFSPQPTNRSVLTALHHLLGWGLLSIGAIQFVSARLRGTKGGPTEEVFFGDHFHMTPRRLLFERIHKGLGWLAMPVTLAVTLIGLVLADAPRWMPIVILVWWTLIAIAFWIMQKRGMCLDTYQAIWGPDPSLPGNQIAPIGWRISRRAPK